MNGSFDLRAEFAKIYSNARAAHRRGVFAPDLFRLATATLRTACHRLALPRLTPEERARMLPADIPGMQELMLALDTSLRSFPDLAKALSLTQGVMAELQAKDVDLLTSIERATAIVQGADLAERSAAAQLKELTTLVSTTAARLRDEPPSEAAADQAADLLALLARFDLRVNRTQKRRQQRLRRRLQAYTAATQDAQAQARLGPHNIVAAHDPSVLPRAEEDRPPAPDTPGAGPRGKEPAERLFPEIPGAPLRECLHAPLPAFHDVRDQLADVAAQLHDDDPAEPPEDYLYYIELGALLSCALHEAPRVQAESQVSPPQLAALCAQADDASLLSATAQLFASMASDGHLFVAAFTSLLYERATAWLRRRAADPACPLELRQRLEVEALRLEQVHGRARDRLADRKARAEGQVKAAQAEVSAAQQQANLARVKDRLRRGLPVDAPSFFAAEELQQRLHQQDLARTAETHAQTQANTAAPVSPRKRRRAGPR
jgi:hypothetical protein